MDEYLIQNVEERPIRLQVWGKRDGKFVSWSQIVLDPGEGSWLSVGEQGRGDNRPAWRRGLDRCEEGERRERDRRLAEGYAEMTTNNTDKEDHGD